MDFELTPEIEEKIKLLVLKYDSMGQDLTSYLDGLLYANYLTYWDYIHLETLLSLQDPKTDFPDETIFITYHQITELYFKLIMHELDQVSWLKDSNGKVFLEKIRRVNRYFRHLVNSFEIMVEGMDYTEFLKFRMSLLPASGFQSVQYRQIEILCTDFRFLVEASQRGLFDEHSRIEEMFGYAYWKRGAVETESGLKTLTLRQFERKYSEDLLKLTKRCRTRNLWFIFSNRLQDSTLKDKIIYELRTLDALVNVDWRLSHFQAAVRYLNKDKEAIAATGGTNWQKYLPPRFQKQVFYPSLWSKEELENWGKSWVVQHVGSRTRLTAPSPSDSFHSEGKANPVSENENGKTE
jgi:tryptophan 2,3-dioxygenase